MREVLGLVAAGHSNAAVAARLPVTEAAVGTSFARDDHGGCAGTCRFWFAVKGVPTGQSPYVLRVADEDARQYPEQDIHGPLVTLHLD
ncbi:hypothetical protein ONA70_10690 [Micromonospora yasonensis]|uniref:hypothetical protein n=1 Tax=Micromonospora yasonensis TaxID=1128667 RepID=UPI00223077BB|nr:hypothetical protein [Micromonospora yasonensis]MCW3840563.1 hypothetical protein [Micromonospora yasonensis]